MPWPVAPLSAVPCVCSPAEAPRRPDAQTPSNPKDHHEKSNHQLSGRPDHLNWQSISVRLELRDDQDPSLDQRVRTPHRQRNLPLERDFLVCPPHRSGIARKPNFGERRINDLAANQIALRRTFSHLGVLALNRNEPSAPNGEGRPQKPASRPSAPRDKTSAVRDRSSPRIPRPAILVVFGHALIDQRLHLRHIPAFLRAGQRLRTNILPATRVVTFV
jgi:hypothetical protein